MKTKFFSRFAPSPTGILHIGNLRTALFSFLHVKKKNGYFILRIDDSNIKEIKTIFILKILKSLTWLKIKYTKGPYFQSLRINRYNNISKYFIKINKAKKCYCINNNRCNCIKKKKNLLYSIKIILKLNENIQFFDNLKKKQNINTNNIKDIIIMKTNRLPTYNFCSTIDDIDMNISDIIRGEDHLTNTIKQLIIYKILNINIPKYTHLSLIIDNKKKKLSKKKKNQNILYLKYKGILKLSIINYLLSLGFSYKNKEIYSYDEMIKIFSINLLNKSPCTFNIKKLEWFNKIIITHTNIDQIKIEHTNNLLIIKNKYNIDKISNIIKKKKITIYNIHNIIKNIEISIIKKKKKKNPKIFFYKNLLKDLYKIILINYNIEYRINYILKLTFKNEKKSKKFLRKYIIDNIENNLDIIDILCLIKKKILLEKIKNLFF